MKKDDIVVFTHCIKYSMYNYDLTINKQYKVTATTDTDNAQYIRVLNDINEQSYYTTELFKTLEEVRDTKITDILL